MDKLELSVIEEQVILGQMTRIYGPAEEPLFLAEDIAGWIKYFKTEDGNYDIDMMVEPVDEAHKVIGSVLQEGQRRDAWFLTEAGIYDVLTPRRQPKARDRRRSGFQSQKTTGGVTMESQELAIIDEREVLGQQFRVFGTVENPLFLAKDVAQWIEYDNNRIAELVAMVDADEKLTSTISMSGQHRKMWFLTEDGLYEILMLSRKPKAKLFKKEVKKILHDVRLNGGYVTNKRAAEFVEKEFAYLPDDLLRQVVAHVHEYNRDLTHQVDVLDTKVRLLNREALQWADRDFINAAVRRLANAICPRANDYATKVSTSWRVYYVELLYNHGICMESRTIDQTTGKPLDYRSRRLNVLKDSEIPAAVQAAVALCERYQVDLSELIEAHCKPAVQMAVRLDAAEYAGLEEY